MKRALGRGRSVAQFLGGEVRAPFGAIIRWLTIREDRDAGHVVHLHEASDLGSDTFVDVGELPSIHGEEELETTFSSFEAALAYAVEKLGAARDRFVDESMIDDEYADFLRAR